MYDAETCAICAQSLRRFTDWDEKAAIDSKSKKLDCCGRRVCSTCQSSNPRYGDYCLYCHPVRASHAPSSAASQSKEDDQSSISRPSPSLTQSSASRLGHTALDLPPEYDAPPPYNTIKPSSPTTLTQATQSTSSPTTLTHAIQSTSSAPDPISQHCGVPAVIHHLRPQDNVTTLRVAYGFPINQVLVHNGIFDDKALHTRRILCIPRTLYRGPSKSPDPTPPSESDVHSARAVKMMRQCRVNRDAAEVYLRNADWDLDRALQQWRRDEAWEASNPVPSSSNARGLRQFGGRDLSPRRMAKLLQ